jgi:hypothetical protein
MDRWMDYGWMHECMDGWMIHGGQMDEWMMVDG